MLSPILAIFIERLAIIGSAFACIFFGWNLFRNSIVMGQDGKLTAGEWNVELKQVGPGIFFSLFGAAVLIAAFLHPMEFSTDSSGVSRARGLLAQSEAEQIRFVRAVNSIGAIKDSIGSQTGASVTLLRADADELDLAAKRLEEFRDQIVVAKFGSNALAKWRVNAAALRDNPTSLSPELQNEIRKVESWMTTNMTSERGR